MAPVENPWQTTELRLKYNNGLDEHSVSFRFSSLVSQNTALGNMASAGVPSAIAALISQDGAPTGVEWREGGSHIFLPIVWEDWSNLGFANSNAATAANRGRFVSVQARSKFRRTTSKYTLFVGFSVIDDTFRYLPGEWAAADEYRDAIALLASEGYLVTADNAACIVHSYVNTGLNAHYQRKARG
jgi:hypothetical protein